MYLKNKTGMKTMLYQEEALATALQQHVGFNNTLLVYLQAPTASLNLVSLLWHLNSEST